MIPGYLAKKRRNAAEKIQTAWRKRLEGKVMEGALWKKVELNNLPNQDPVSYNNFRNGNKAIKFTWKTGNKNHHAYFTPKTIAALMGVRNTPKAMLQLKNRNPSDVVFKNPLFGGSWVKRKDINFVILTGKKPKASSKAKKNAAATLAQFRKNAKKSKAAMAELVVSQLKNTRPRSKKRRSRTSCFGSRCFGGGPNMSPVN